MAGNDTFARTELKYRLTAAQGRFLRDALAPYVRPDKYGESTICNIYFDTPDFRLIRKSIEKPVYKEKLRLRSYGPAFDDIFETFTTESRLTGVKTTNLGSLNRLTYAIHMKEAGHEKELIDALRVRNGNLEINMMLRSATEGETL